MDALGEVLLTVPPTLVAVTPPSGQVSLSHDEKRVPQLETIARLSTTAARSTVVALGAFDPSAAWLVTGTSAPSG